MSTNDKVVTLTLSPEFAKFLESVHRQHKIDSNIFNEAIIALDPGETTGVAEFDGDHTITVYQKETKDICDAFDWLKDKLYQGPDHQFSMGNPDRQWWFKHLRYEDYRVYEWKTADHAWSQVHTLRWIGAILVAAHVQEWPINVSCCLAMHAKTFWKDDKLKHFNLYPSGLRHGKDALRHLLYYMLFPTKVDS